MKNKIYAFIVAVTLFVSINNISSAAEQQNLKVGKIEFSQLRELPAEGLLSKLPVKSGDDYSNKSMSDIYLALKKLEYVDNVNIIPEINGDTVNLRVEVKEMPNAGAEYQEEQNIKALSQKTDLVISKIDIVGLNKVPKEEVLKILSTKEGQQFVPIDVRKEAQKIYNLGYFTDIDPKIDRKADNTVSITYEVKENPVVTGIEITGNTLFTDDQLKQALGIKEGQILNGNLLNPDNNGIIKLYEKNGYVTAKIQSINAGEDGKIKIGVTEGVVQNVTFSKASNKTDDERANPKRANLRTKPYVLERYLEVKPGEVLEGKNIESTMQEMYRTGIFNRIEPNITGSETDPNARNVEFLIEERPTTTINGSISYGTSVGVIGGLKLADDNFLGRDQQASLNIEASNKGDKTFSINWYDPWMRNTERIGFGGSAYWTQSVDDDADWDELEKVKVIGTKWSISKGLNKDITVTGSARLDHKKEIYSGGEVKDSYNLFALNPELIYDTRDNINSPTKGLYADLSYERGELLGDSRKYDRFDIDLRAYHPLFGKNNIMAYRAVWGSTGSKTPDSMRYAVGGSETLRGYEYGAFEGYDQFYASIENRTKINDTFQLVGFFDIGNAWQKTGVNASGRKIYFTDRTNARKFKDLKKGYGIGLRINTPVGPLRFDYGWPMDPEKPGQKKDKGKFYFSFGQSF